MKRLAGLSTLALMISATSGCGWLWGDDGYFRDRGSDYLSARQTAPMQVAVDGETRPLDPLLPIPQQVADSTWQGAGGLNDALVRNLGIQDGETRVRVRVEPGVQRNTSEIFVVSVKRPAGSTADVAWPEISSNKELDRVLLDELQASLTQSAKQGGSVSLLAERDFDAPSRVNLTEDGSGNPLLQLDSDFDRAWSSIGRALQAADVRVDDLDRSLGVYYVNLSERADDPDDKPGFFSRLFGGAPDKDEIEARAERYQVRLTRVGNGVQVSLDKSVDTVAPADVARRVLSLLKDNLG